MEKVADDHGPFDIIIDDGSHVNGHVIETFKIMFPKLKDGGVYVIEDIQTAYWDDFGGDSKNLQNPGTSMNFAKSLTDCVNYQEIIGENYQESYYDRHIVSIHFYHNLVFIHKDLNDEPSNIVHNHKKPVMRHD
jgi:demethylmacrocin O-methyltransferase